MPEVIEWHDAGNQLDTTKRIRSNGYNQRDTANRMQPYEYNQMDKQQIA